MTFIVDGTNGLTFNDSSIQKAAARVLQVVSATSSTNASTTGGTYVASGITASITPTSATSKIFVVSSWWQSVSGNGVTVACTLYRNSTDLGNPSFGFTAMYLPSSSGETTGAINYLDSPATTSSTSYTIYFKRIDNAGTAYCGNSGRTSVITLLEIAG
jgi:hypothetical protein